jgi:hypothetical protein
MIFFSSKNEQKYKDFAFNLILIKSMVAFQNTIIVILFM